jgi:hypothetical protein
MPYDVALADRVREHLAATPGIAIEEKVMFGVLNFVVNGKTCVCVRGDSLMLRFDPDMQEELAERTGYATMLMKGKTYKGYCYIQAEGLQRDTDFQYYMRICLDHNARARSARRRR